VNVRTKSYTKIFQEHTEKNHPENFAVFCEKSDEDEFPCCKKHGFSYFRLPKKQA
jgi:hypothetical protein